MCGFELFYYNCCVNNLSLICCIWLHLAFRSHNWCESQIPSGDCLCWWQIPDCWWQIPVSKSQTSRHGMIYLHYFPQSNFKQEHFIVIKNAIKWFLVSNDAKKSQQIKPISDIKMFLTMIILTWFSCLFWLVWVLTQCSFVCSMLHWNLKKLHTRFSFQIAVFFIFLHKSA